MVSVKCSGSGLESTDHFFGSFFKKHSGQLRVKQRLELKGNIEFHFAGLWSRTRGEPPDRLKMAEQRPLSGHGPDLVVWDIGQLRDVAFEERGESDHQLCTTLAIISLKGPRLLTPRDKLTVLIHVCHYVVHLLRSVP